MQFVATVVEKILQDMFVEGEEIQAPLDERTFSGKFNLRLGPDLHKKVAVDSSHERGHCCERCRVGPFAC